MIPARLKQNIPAVAALAVLGLLAVALARRRFKLGYVLLHVAVALAERWQDQRAKARLGAALSSLEPDPWAAQGLRTEGELWNSERKT
jgi:hypothetical protein